MKKVSDGHGGEDYDLFQKQFWEVLESYPYEKIEEAIACYQEMVNDLQYFKIKGW